MSVARRAVVFGETVVDLYPDGEVVAGSPLHVAANLAHRGWTAYLVTRVGRDERGERVLATIGAHGIDPSFVEVDPELPTGTVTVRASGAHNEFTIHGPAAWEALCGPETLPDHDALSYGTLVCRAEVSRAALGRALARSRAAHRVLDLNLRPPDVRTAWLRQTLVAATTIKANEDELALAAELLRLDPSPASYLAALPGLRCLCVTRGADGAELHARSGSSALRPPPVEVTNTVGAGDAFTAGLIDGLARGAPPEEVLAAAHRCAAAILTRRGGLPDGV